VTELTDVPASPRERRRATGAGGAEGNELLTIAAATVLVILLLAEGVTILHLNGLLGAHMFIGLMLIPPVLLKLASTGYRFARYYTGSPVYRAKGPPQLPLRVLAPVLVAATVMVFATGVWLLVLGHRSDQVLMLHKVSFIVWGGLFGVHFLAYAPRVARSLVDRAGARTHAGGRTRVALVIAAIAAGLALGLSLLSLIGGWHGGHDVRVRDAAVPDEHAGHHDAAGSGISFADACSRGACSCTRWRTIRSASLPAPPTSIDANECRNGRPAK
jgi:hypothetical protein